MRRDVGSVDLGAYVRALGLLVRNPALAVPTLAASLASLAAAYLFSPTGALGIGSLVATVITWFGVAVAVILGDVVWRRGTGSLRSAWSDARRRAGDIVMAALGITFVQVLVSYLAMTLSFLPGFVIVVLNLAVTFFFVYTVPAAAIGGITGGNALQVSLERVQRNRLNAAVLTALVVLAPQITGALSVLALPLVIGVPWAALVVAAVLKGLVDGYTALMLARGYTDVSFGRIW